MAKRLLTQLLFLAMTVMLAACGTGEEGSTTTTPSPSTNPPATQPPAGSGSGSSPPPTNPPPPQPTASLTLAWNPNTESDLAGYKIYGATSSGAYGAANATLPVNATSFVATGLQPGVTYFFVITATDTAGNESARSSEVKAVAPL